VAKGILKIPSWRAGNQLSKELITSLY